MRKEGRKEGRREGRKELGEQRRRSKAFQHFNQNYVGQVVKLREIVNVVLRGVRRISAENPKVAAGAKERYVREGTNVTLTCEADHVLKQDANVTTSWKFKEQTIPLPNDFRHEANTYRGDHSARLELVVRNAFLSDSGDYACNVVNREGSAMATTKLHVQSKGETSFPASLSSLPPVEIKNLEMRLRLDCVRFEIMPTLFVHRREG